MNPRVRPAPPALPFPQEPGAPENGSPPEADAAREAAEPVGSPWDHCPNCSARLVSERRRLRCTGCHYFMSGVDFDGRSAGGVPQNVRRPLQ